MNSSTEEDYLKTIYMLSAQYPEGVLTSAIAERMETKASSVTDMLKKLSEKGHIHYVKYQGVTLEKKGNDVAVKVIRKHRLWEVFLCEKLDFTWDEIHEIAEQLEHITSVKLVDSLDKFLGFPKVDPHGDPIPDKNGNFHKIKEVALRDLKIGDTAVVIGVREDSKEFLKYLESIKLLLGAKLEVINKFEFDESVLVKVNNENEIMLSSLVCKNLSVSHEKNKK